MTPMKAIRAKCLDCCCGSAKEVKLCTATQCSLYNFRDGHNPNIKRKGNPDAFKKYRNITENFDKEGDNNANS